MPESNSTTNKVFQTLACLSGQERRRLLKYLTSAAFNQSDSLIRLFQYFSTELDAGHAAFSREKAWMHLQPGQVFEDVNFRKYCSDLLKLVEAFLAQENFEVKTGRYQLELLDSVVQHKIEPLYNSAIRQAKRTLETAAYKSSETYYQSYELERLYYSMQDFDVRVNVRANLEEISSNLDVFYWIEKLKLYIAVISQRKTGNFEYKIQFVDELLAFLAKYPVETVPELALYYYSFLTIFEENELSHYRNFRRVLDQYGKNLPPQTAIELYDSALHYCTGKLNKGDRFFMQEHFDIFVEAIEKGIFMVNGELAPWRFNNAVGVALGLGKLEWAERFVEQYKDMLPQSTRQNTYAFNLARVYRFQGKYKEVLQLLSDLEYEDIGYNLLSKRMVIMTYYDLDEFDALESYMESFRVFLNRNKGIPAMRRRSYLNWLKYVRRLTRLLPGDKSDQAELKAEILQNKAGIANHEWLLEKLGEL
ncbi:MAG: hypothetical protein IPL65_22050 [Lewinellaceae bacterium]|nr:hypothetical protein [Lewinellaceae bacterium]